MTIEEAATLVLKASLQALGGEVFVTKMPIEDPGKAMIDLGVKPHYLNESSMEELLRNIRIIFAKKQFFVE